MSGALRAFAGTPRAWLAGGIIVAALFGAGVAGLALAHSGPAASAANSAGHFADADNPALVVAGRAVYAGNCASCHGRRLQGQALWQLMDQYAGRRAPAQDATGHSWQHSDEALFAMTKFGRFPGEPANTPSYMPGFAGRLGDRDIVAVIAYIKANWPLGLRVAQAMLNPGFAGMPADADRVEWRLPPTCSAVLRREESAFR